MSYTDEHAAKILRACHDSARAYRDAFTHNPYIGEAFHEAISKPGQDIMMDLHRLDAALYLADKDYRQMLSLAPDVLELSIRTSKSMLDIAGDALKRGPTPLRGVA